MVQVTPITAPQNPDTTGREIIVDGTVALSGSYTVHGDTLNLQQFQDLAKSSQLPTKVEVWEDPAAGTSPTFAQFVFCPGTTQLNGLLAIAAAGGRYGFFAPAFCLASLMASMVMPLRGIFSFWPG